MTRNRTLAALLAVLALALGLIAAPSQASAVSTDDDLGTVTTTTFDLPGTEIAVPAAASPYEGWRLTYTTNCIEVQWDNPNWDWVETALDWNSTEMNFYVRKGAGSCTTPTNREITVHGYSAADGNCGFARIWHLNARVTKAQVWTNIYYPGCYQTDANRDNFRAHELGHIIGLAHEPDRIGSIMYPVNQPSPSEPDALSELRVNGLMPPGA